MPITILGSWREGSRTFPFHGSQGEFAKACEAIGGMLARKEQQVIVGSDSEESAEYHVVKGIVDQAEVDQTLTPKIHVIRPSTGFIFGDLWRQHGRLFTAHRRTQPSREGTQIISVQDANAVLTIGGAKSTYRTGLAAIAAKKTLVPIASFGGASSNLLDALEQFGQIRNKQELGVLYGPWSDSVMQTALRLSGVTRQPRILIIHGRSDDRFELKNWLNTQVRLETNNIIIMGEQYGVGSTLPEKFETLASNVDAAIAIATPDDVGGLETTAPTDYEPRARQNVWLEVGWFWGRLGRDKILILRKGDIEPPSDLSGLEYDVYGRYPSEAGDIVRKFIEQIQQV